VCLYLFVALSLIGPLGAVGLALANAAQNSAHALILLVLLQRALPGLRLVSALLPFLARTLPAAAIVYVVLAFSWPSLSGLGGFAGLIAAGLLAGGVYVALLLALGVSEVRAAFALVRQRIRA
jgi:peptidoglycan biosynthesis protein MviN/MurJ (putative lipid II flippase)